MKKKLLILTVLVFLSNPVNASAISANINCSAPSSVNVGDTFNVTISGSADSSTYWNGGIVNSSSNLRSNSGTGSFVEQNSTTSISKTYSFTALSEGSATVSQSMTISDENYNEKTFNSSTCTINIVKPTTQSTNKVQSNVNNLISNKTNDNKNNNNSDNKDESSDNSLKELSIEGYTISPEFNKDTLEYKVKIPNEITKIKVNAVSNDEKATVEGIGEIEVKEGNNVINVTVTSENGAKRVYVINAYVQEKSPITVTVGNKKYTLVKKLSNMEPPIGFKQKNVIINDEEIEAFYNEKLDYTIVALKDSIGNILLYVYDADLNKYTKYSPIVNNGLSIIVLDAPRDKIPYRYHKTKFTYNNNVIDGYALSESSDFRVIYAINIETNEKGFYLFDLKDNTVQRFYNDQVNIYIRLIEKIKIAFLILGGFIIFEILIIIILLSKNAKFKRKYIDKRLSKIDNPIKEDEIKYEDIEDTTSIDDVVEQFDDIDDFDDVELPSKKRRKKEKTFLDE